MNIQLEDLKDKNLVELTTHLQGMAQDVLDAKARYDALIQEQRVYTQARDFKGLGLWPGDRIQILGKKRGQTNPIAIVVSLGRWDDLVVNVLKKDGSRREENDAMYSFEKYEKLESEPA